jgi:hypothetical protein
MQTEYKYLVFVETDNSGRKTSIWECRNKSSGTVLGEVRWYGAWRQYCYFLLYRRFIVTVVWMI